MKTLSMIAKPLSWASLLLIAVPPVLLFTGSITADSFQLKPMMLIGTVIWFVTTPLWMKGE